MMKLELIVKRTDGRAETEVLQRRPRRAPIGRQGCPRADLAAPHAVRHGQARPEVRGMTSHPHVYTPARWSPIHEARLVAEYGTWYDVPNDLRYSECVCGLAWAVHK